MTGTFGPWFQLGVAIALEVAGTFLLKLSDGFTKMHWGVLAIALYAVCFVVLASVLRAIPVGITYAVWSGVGIVAIAALGFIVFDEKLGAGQVVYIVLILVGVAGLRLTTSN